MRAWRILFAQGHRRRQRDRLDDLKCVFSTRWRRFSGGPDDYVPPFSNLIDPRAASLSRRQIDQGAVLPLLVAILSPRWFNEGYVSGFLALFRSRRGCRRYPRL